MNNLPRYTVLSVLMLGLLSACASTMVTSDRQVELRNKLTTLMVTHDVDESIFLSDRVVMMTDGPEAEVGDILPIPFERPRNRAAASATWPCEEP